MRIDTTNKQMFGMKISYIGGSAIKAAEDTAQAFTLDNKAAIPVIQNSTIAHIAEGEHLASWLNAPGLDENAISKFFKDAVKIFVK